MTTDILSLPYLSYPNPRMRREGYTLLNGIWDFEFLTEMKIPDAFTSKIRVPFTYETEYSLIHDSTLHEYIGYRRMFKSERSNYLLHFEGVDYEAKVYVDRKEVASHKGAYTSFEIPLDLEEGEHELIVLVHDTYSKSQMRGKQRTRGENYECWYTQFTGIFKDVYLEKIGKRHVKSILVDGDKYGKWHYDIKLSEKADILVTLSLEGKTIKEISLTGKNEYIGEEIEKEFRLYSSSSPILYDLSVEIKGEDKVSTYFGFRRIEAREEKIFINDEELYLRMILDQGYYDKKGVTPEKEDIIKDLSLIYEIGFNGIRIHQKQESNLFYYIADALGIYLWSEMPSCYEYSLEMKKEIESSLPSIIEKNYNSPSVLSYVLFNESWGIPTINHDKECQDFVNAIGKMTKEKDKTRLVILNDGWFQLTETEILSLHEYEQNSQVLNDEYQDKNNVVSNKIINHYGKAFSENNHYQNQPIILSEFGGASLTSSDGWGYGEKRESINDYKNQLINIFSAVRKLNYLSGYCYTQLSDVEQETNGLFYIDRTPKIPLNEMRKIILGGDK